MKRARIVYYKGAWCVASGPILTGWERHLAAVDFCRRLSQKEK